MHKHPLSKLIGIWLLALILGSVAIGKAKQPNVLFIFIDDQGYYDLSSYGATEVKTPHIDGLAERGVKFTQFYSAAPICSPSRAGLLTGQYPRRTGNEVWVHRPDAHDGIPEESVTMAETFRAAGYATACIGKWHLGFKEEFLPLNQGFDYHYGILHNLDQYEVDHFKEEGGMPFLRNGEVIARNVSADDLTKMYTDESIAWIEKQAGADKPFFLYLPHTMLHDPLGVSAEFRGSSQWGEYGDAIQEMDHNVGRMVKALERLGIADDTLVIYSSDNGRWPGRNKDQPIRGSKLNTFEGGLRVPAIIAGASVAKGITTDAVAHAMDWYPTLASLAGVEIQEDIILDGRDLSAMLEGKTEDIPAFDNKVSLNAEVPLRRPVITDTEWDPHFTQEEYLNAFFYHGSHGALSAVRSGAWKLYLHPKLTLYNLEDDPGERKEIHATWPKAGDIPKTEMAKARAEAWRIKSKLRGMVIQFQREMNQYIREK
ncbi:MAG: sulfatase family protein [Opitutales bacterium]